MAFPTVISVSHHTSTDQTATHSVTLPSNTTEGRLLLMIGVFSGTVMSVNVPSGWTEKVTQDTNGGYEVLFIFAKKTTGSEGSTQTVTTGGAGILAASTYLIDNWRGASAADDVKAALGIPTAGITAPWPTPNLDPGWSTEDTLWFAVSADLAASTWTLAAPTDYSGLERALAGDHRSVYTARRALRAATHNPADWTVATGSYHSTRWYNQVATIAVRSLEISEMTFPTVIGVSHYTSDSWTTSHTIPLPSNSTADRLLLMIGYHAGDGTESVTTPSGWTQVAHVDTSTILTFILAKKTSGSEGDSVAVTCNSGRMAVSTYLISGYRASATVTDDVKAAVDYPNTSITAPWPTPNLDPGWGAEDILWFVYSGEYSTSGWTLNAPTDYGNLERSLITSEDRSCYTARRELNASSHNPADWTVSGTYHNDRWQNMVATLAVRPAESTPIPVFQHYYSRLRD